MNVAQPTETPVPSHTVLTQQYFLYFYPCCSNNLVISALVPTGTKKTVLVGGFPNKFHWCDFSAYKCVSAMPFPTRCRGLERTVGLLWVLNLSSGVVVAPYTITVFFWVPVTSYQAIPSHCNPLSQVIVLYSKCSLFKLLCGFSLLIRLWLIHNPLKFFYQPDTAYFPRGEKIMALPRITCKYSMEGPWPCRLARSSWRGMKNEHCPWNFRELLD